MDLLLSLVAKDAASEVFGKFSGEVLAAGKAVVSMMKSAAEAEKVERQLHRVAGELTDTFRDQAKAISEQLAVEDELVMSMQTLQLAYGAAPAAVEGTTRAILDYAAATGRDAQSATEALLKGVQQGTGSIKGLGIQYKATGDFTKDMAAATEALAKRFNGAAETDAETLGGSARAAKIALGELEESLGALFNGAASKVHAFEAIAYSLNAINDALFGQKDGAERRADLLKQLAGINKTLTGEGLLDRSAQFFSGDDLKRKAEQIKKEIADIEASWLKAGQAAAPALGASSLPGFEGKVKEHGSKGKSQEERDLEFKISMEETQRQFREKEHAWDTHLLELENKEKKAAADSLERQQKYTADWLEESQTQLTRAYGEQDEAQLKHFARMDKVADDFFKQQKDNSDRSAETWLNAGMRIGDALIDGIISAMKADEGGKSGGAAAVLKTVYGIVGAIVDVIMGAFGGGGLVNIKNSLLSGSDAIGEEASGGVQSGYGMHTGGWVPRYHRGGWMGLMPGEAPIIGQEGERMLSRGEVASMGGKAGVERAVRNGGGGGGNVYNISAFDAGSVTELFGGKGGRGLYNTLRTGKGVLPAAFGRI